jgi:thymidylate synthase (FAD)
MILVRPSFQILDDLNTDRIYKAIERAGRTCYKSEDKITEDSAEKFVRMVLKRGHESVIEHEKVSVRIVCDRGVSHEIVRHRIASYSQESTRYCKYKGQIALIHPPGLTEEQQRRREHHYRLVQDLYDSEIAEGLKPEIARGVLPNSLKTEIVMTMNLREWRHFFKLRTAPAAHPQMREIAIPLLSEFKHRLPVIFEDINPPHSEHFYLPVNERN